MNARLQQSKQRPLIIIDGKVVRYRHLMVAHEVERVAQDNPFDTFLVTHKFTGKVTLTIDTVGGDRLEYKHVTATTFRGRTGRTIAEVTVLS